MGSWSAKRHLGLARRLALGLGLLSTRRGGLLFFPLLPCDRGLPLLGGQSLLFGFLFFRQLHLGLFGGGTPWFGLRHSVLEFLHCVVILGLQTRDLLGNCRAGSLFRSCNSGELVLQLRE